MKSPERCPVCGTAIAAGVMACPECGSDERTGWKEEASWHDGLDFPGAEEDFDYEAFLEREGLSASKPRGFGLRSLAGGLLLLAFLIWVFFGR